MPKSELLSWLNDLLKLDYTRVEQCANGAGKATANRKEHARASSLSRILDHLRVGPCVYNLRLSLRTRERERERVCVYVWCMQVRSSPELLQQISTERKSERETARTRGRTNGSKGTLNHRCSDTTERQPDGCIHTHTHTQTHTHTHTQHTARS